MIVELGRDGGCIGRCSNLVALGLIVLMGSKDPHRIVRRVGEVVQIRHGLGCNHGGGSVGARPVDAWVAISLVPMMANP